MVPPVVSEVFGCNSGRWIRLPNWKGLKFDVWQKKIAKVFSSIDFEFVVDLFFEGVGNSNNCLSIKKIDFNIFE